MTIDTRRPPASEPIPLIIVEGFLGGAGAMLWGDFDQSLNLRSGRCKNRRTMFTSVGPVSSLHDRACELYYTLTGGTVDYGENHAKLYNHSRYGRVNTEGIYPQWSPERPLHFLGHSIGGATIIKLQFLLEQGHFGPHGHPDMILSVNTISAPFRGTQLVYILGERTDAAPAVRPLSVGSLLAKWVHLVIFFSPLLPRILNLHAEARSLSFHDISPISLLKQLWKSDWAESRDSTPFDVTFEAADERESNLEGQVHSRTYYRSHVASMNQSPTTHTSYLRIPSLTSILSHPLHLLSRSISTFDYSALQPTPSFLKNDVPASPSSFSTSFDVEKNLTLTMNQSSLGKEYRENDGVVPLFSQWHPLPCSSTRCQHFEHTESDVAIEDNKLPELNPGIWNVHHMDAANHISLVPYWTGSSRQRHFWSSLGQWLRTIDDQIDIP